VDHLDQVFVEKSRDYGHHYQYNLQSDVWEVPVLFHITFEHFMSYSWVP